MKFHNTDKIFIEDENTIQEITERFKNEHDTYKSQITQIQNNIAAL